MAENKINWSELRKQLATRANISEREANVFLSALNAQIVEAIKQDKQVKINGLGMFKLQAVAPRKSVNVTTGEQITIEGYNKLAFVPEAGVKELVEKVGVPVQTDEEPSTPTEMDPIQKLGAQADEIVGIIGELNQMEEPIVEEPVIEEPVVEEPVIEETKEENQIINNDMENNQPTIIPEPTPTYQPTPTYEPTPSNEPEQAPIKPKKESHFLRDTLICVVILLLILLIGYFFFREQIGGYIEGFLPKDKGQVEFVADSIDAGAEEGMEMEESDEILAEFLQASEEGDIYANEATSAYPELITVEPMHEASRLAWMSKRYYGAKVYWPYLYDANRDRLDDPNDIEVGTPIRVPKLTKLQLDTTNAQTMATLERLLEEAKMAMK